MVNADAINREKILFSYSMALEEGDFARLGQILKLAEDDPVLERQIVEINTSLIAKQGGAAQQVGEKTRPVNLGQ